MALMAALPMFALGQVNRYFVFLKDKVGTNYSIDRPEEFLSVRSVERRANQGISVTDSDLPVSEDYISQVSQTGADVFFASKWFNGLLIQAEEAEVGSISALSFVDSVTLVAQGERLQGETLKVGRLNVFGNRIKSDKETEAQNSMLSIDDMHSREFRGEGITVAVFDGGFAGVDDIDYFQHVFDDERMLATRDFVTNTGNVYQYDDHGTRVFSAIAGLNEGEFVGTAYNSNFILCITEDVESETRIEEYNWLLGAEFADSVGVDIINTSLGYNLFDDAQMNYTHDDLDGQTAIISIASNMAAEKGILLIASAGNEGNNSWVRVTPPADSPSVLAVGGVNGSGVVSAFSSLGPTADERIKPDVVALSSNVTLINSQGNLTSGNGTSFSAPLVAGLAAGIWQANPELTNFELIEVIKLSADNADSPNSSLGYGVPDFIGALPNPVLSVEDIFEGRIKVYPNPFRGNRIFIDLDASFVGDDLSIEFFSLSGSLLAQRTYSNQFFTETVQFEIDQDIVPGTYILRLSNTSKITEVKLLKY